MLCGKTWIVGLGVTLLTLGCGEGPDQTPVSANGGWRFTEVTESAGLSQFRHFMGGIGQLWLPESIGAGGAFLDYDGDGFIDVVLVAGGPLGAPSGGPALELYRNRGDGTFERRTDAAGLGGLRAYGMGVFPADIDNDGNADLFLTTLHQNILLRNDGGVFRDVSVESGLGEVSEWSTAAAFFDADRDGYLDLYVGNYVRWTPEEDRFCSLDGVAKSYCTPQVYEGVSGRFYRNNGDGTFTDRTAAAGFAGAPGNTLGAVAFDYDRDGWTDLFVANDLERDLLFRNNGDLTFDEIGLRSGVAFDERGNARAGMGTDAGVMDETGHVTIFVGNFSHEPISVFRYMGDNAFMNRDVASRMLRPTIQTLTFALFLFDADLDGNLDVFAVNGHVQTDVSKIHERITYRQPPHLFLNAGDGTFTDVAPELGAPLTIPLAGRGGAYADIDGDGDLDLLVTENDGPAHLWRNDLPRSGSEGPNYLRIHLRGTHSNRDAIGAHVTVLLGGAPLFQERRGGGGYLGTSEPTLTFGLGRHGHADSVIVDWPSGARSALHRVAANQTIHVVE